MLSCAFFKNENWNVSAVTIRFPSTFALWPRPIETWTRPCLPAHSAQDLFYRLHVFPIHVPPLRERKNDIPLLVEYLVERYARRAGKTVSHIKKKTLEMLQTYDWPGNVRELQNVIERAVILCDGETFSVDPTWLRSRSNQVAGRVSRRGVLAEDKKEFTDRERKAIEAALAQCQGRVSGPNGAAAILGIPHQTLESKIASLGIDKRRFKVQGRLAD